MAEISPMDTMMEEREELMVSPVGGNPTRRVGRFLRPTISLWEDLPPFPLALSPDMSHLKHTQSDVKNRGVIPQLEVHFRGWRPPQKKWKTWIDQLKPRWQHIWKQAGIYEAILASCYKIKRDKDMIIDLSGRWCSDTNTFVLPWGEATITLEDIMVLGGFSVLGDSILNPVACNDFVKIEEELGKVHRRIKKSYVRHYSWMDHFMGSNELEHEAFLTLWLSRYVFPIKYDTVESKFFPLAINLSRGIRLALAPAILSSIYRDMSLLKKSIDDLIKFGNCNAINLWAPFQLVQLWAWERFPTLGPQPKAINFGEPRPSRWDSLPKLKTRDVQKTLDSTGESFEWRPYAKFLNNWCASKFSREIGGWIFVESDMDEELQSLVRCLRISELLGLDCVEQYLPHRVALQFGMDQDIPRSIRRLNETPESAWNSYCMPIRNRKLYVPGRMFEADVTYRYLEWWKQSMLAQEVLSNDTGRGHQKPNSTRFPQVSWPKQEDDYFPIPPGIPSNFNNLDSRYTVGATQSTNTNLLNQKIFHSSVMNSVVSDGPLSSPVANIDSKRKESSVGYVEMNMRNQPLMDTQKRAVEDISLMSAKRPAINYKRNAVESSTFNFIKMDGLQPKSHHDVDNSSMYKI